MNEVIDEIGGGLRLIRRKDQFALGTDAVLLSKFVTLTPRDRVIDLGAGIGSIPLLLCSRAKLKKIVAMELQPQLVDLCRRSVKLNDLEDQIEVVEGDIRNCSALFPAGSFDLVTCNPPYQIVNGAQVNAQLTFALARHELSCTLADVARASAWLVRFGGKVALVHRPQRLGDIFSLFRTYKLEPKRLQLVYPKPGKDANIALVEGMKGGKPGLRVLPPLILRGANLGPPD